MKKPPIDEVQISREEGEELVRRIREDQLNEADRERIATLLQTFLWLSFALRETRIGLGRLKSMLFGDNQPGRRAKKPKVGDGDGGDGGGGDGGSDVGSGGPDGGSSPAVDEPPASDSESKTGKRNAPGHGRLAADAYIGAKTVRCAHPTLAAGMKCPECARGTVYKLDPKKVVRIVGHPFLDALRYELERLRCSACLQIFTAPLPEAAGEEKYQPSARALLALSRYFLGVPFYRLQSLQALLGVPVADATQWDQLEPVAAVVKAVFEQMRWEAAQSELLFHDDTHVRILSLLRENRGSSPPERLGMFTTGIVACQGERTIVLYFSGRAHAGENLAALLELREAGLALPQVMSDAATLNQPANLQAHIRCLCLSHGLRQFSDLLDHFPAPSQRVLGDLATVFELDRKTTEQSMTALHRLAYHQAHSQPIMDRLKVWIDEQLVNGEVEPNSSLGKALKYLQRHWHGLTQFLRIAGAPLDSNRVERALKLMIRQRRNSLFFATGRGAEVASVLISVIATCAEVGANPYRYLVALLENSAEVLANPAAFLPWNFAASTQAT